MIWGSFNYTDQYIIENVCRLNSNNNRAEGKGKKSEITIKSEK